MKRLLWLLCLALVAWAAVPWSNEELDRNLQVAPAGPRPVLTPALGLRYNYLHEIQQVCDFVARYQVSDSGSSNFGGIIEAEHMPTTIETDNTQEAIWIWSRWYELTGRDDYRTNIRRAWRYVLTHPAYREGSGSLAWYAVWNCGLGFFCETKYRQAYGDSSYLAYTDTCRQYCFATPLNFTSNPLHGNVTAFTAGMMYRYALERGDPVLGETALAYGGRVRTWVESQPSRLRTGNWAMSGGTIVWGLCNTIWRADTMAGKAWLALYADSIPYFMPTGTWNCSWNIWNANAFRTIWEINHFERFRQYHQHLTDTLIARDRDDDGGIPATWTDPETQDQTWVSTYLDFMGMDTLAVPVFDQDAGVVALEGIDQSRVHLPGDTIHVRAQVANFGRSGISFPVVAVLPSVVETVVVGPLPSLGFDTVDFGADVLGGPGLVPVTVFTQLRDDGRRANDTLSDTVHVWCPRTIQGQLADSNTRTPVTGRVTVYLGSDTLAFAVLNTDTSGRFAFTGIDSSFRIRIQPRVPYPGREQTVRIQSDTLLELWIPAANLLLVDNDSLSRYEAYYTSTFDTLSLDYCLIQRRHNALAPVEVLNRLRDRLVVWYTGQTAVGNLTPEDMDSLARFLDTGGRLFITGQNIGEELGANPFYQARLHARFVTGSIGSFYAYGNLPDSLGSLFGTTQTAGPQGANNQTSRDEIAPDSLARGFLLYDTLSGQIAGIYHHDPLNDSRVIYLGFGFEALNRPQQRPSYMSRVTFFSRCYEWLTGTTALEEGPNLKSEQNGSLRATWVPNPFRRHARLDIAWTGPGPVRVTVYDATGRLAREFSLALAQRRSLTWNGRDASGHELPAGVYLYSVQAGPRKLTGIVRLIR